MIFICYIISTIKIPHRLKNNFHSNYKVISYIYLFRFSFQIRCINEHSPARNSVCVGVRKYIIIIIIFITVSSTSIFSLVLAFTFSLIITSTRSENFYPECII